MSALRRAPSGQGPSLAAWHRLLARAHEDAPSRLAAGLRGLVGEGTLHFHRSGREALRATFVTLAARSSRDEVIVPAYTCYSVAAAAVAAGLRVRLVDVDANGQIDRASLAKLPLERAAAIVVCNLFGIAEPVSDLRAIARSHAVALVDDAAQSLGARDTNGEPAGGRGDAGILSFGRGKPLSAMGGGAVLWCVDPPEAPRVPQASRWGGTLAALAGSIALWPPLFTIAASIPSLHVGETPFEPNFERGSISAASLALAAALVDDVASEGRERDALVARFSARLEPASAFTRVAPAGDAACVSTRIVLRARDAEGRREALRALSAMGVGESAFYPASLDAVPALRAHLADSAAMPGAADLARRILTLPANGRSRGKRIDPLIAALRGVR